jgi:hypothetical protein
VFDVNCNSLPFPIEIPGFTSSIKPGLVPTLTLAVPLVGVGKKDVEAVLDVKDPAPAPKL